MCRQVDAIAAGRLDLEDSIPAFLRDFEATVSSGTLLTAMDAIPVDIGRQLDVVLRLAGMLLHQSNVYSRFAECMQAFTAGIGNGPGATFEGLTAHYKLAHDRCYEPFIERHRYILENYVINTIFRCQFPFGREGMRAGASPSMTREYVQLTAQFALMKGLLIGVAGDGRRGGVRDPAQKLSPDRNITALNACAGGYGKGFSALFTPFSRHRCRRYLCRVLR